MKDLLMTSRKQSKLASDRLYVAAFNRHPNFAAHKLQEDHHPIRIKLSLKHALKVRHRPGLNAHIIARLYGAFCNFKDTIIISLRLQAGDNVIIEGERAIGVGDDVVHAEGRENRPPLLALKVNANKNIAREKRSQHALHLARMAPNCSIEWQPGVIFLTQQISLGATLRAYPAMDHIPLFHILTKFVSPTENLPLKDLSSQNSPSQKPALQYTSANAYCPDDKFPSLHSSIRVNSEWRAIKIHS